MPTAAPWSWTNKPAQLARRISNDLDVIRNASFVIDRRRDAHTKNFKYRITRG